VAAFLTLISEVVVFEQHLESLFLVVKIFSSNSSYTSQPQRGWCPA